jgi:hypothetical protein
LRIKGYSKTTLASMMAVNTAFARGMDRCDSPLNCLGQWPSRSTIFRLALNRKSLVLPQEQKEHCISYLFERAIAIIDRQFNRFLPELPVMCKHYVVAVHDAWTRVTIYLDGTQVKGMLYQARAESPLDSDNSEAWHTLLTRRKGKKRALWIGSSQDSTGCQCGTNRKELTN